MWKSSWEAKVRKLKHRSFLKDPQKVWEGKGGAADNVLIQDPKEKTTEKLLSGVFVNALVPV